MKHFGKVLAAAGVLGTLALITVRGARMAPMEPGRTDPSLPPSVDAHDLAGKLLFSRVIKPGEDAQTIISDLQRELPAKFPEGGKLTLTNGQEWFGLVAPGMSFPWGQGAKPGG